MGGVNDTPQASRPSKWAQDTQERVMNHIDVQNSGQSASSRAFFDMNWEDMWQTGKGGLTDITDVRMAQKPTVQGEPLGDCVMLTGGNYRPVLKGKTDKQVLIRNKVGRYVTVHNVLKNPDQHLKNAKPGCWKVEDGSDESEEVGIGWSILLVPCPVERDFVEIAFQTRAYQATALQNPNKVYVTQYGNCNALAAGCTPNGYQCHYHRVDDKPSWLKVQVSQIQAATRYVSDLSSMSSEDKRKAIQENLTTEGDIITVLQIPLLPDPSKPLCDNTYVDPTAVTEASDAPVYRGLEGAFTAELGAGSEFEMSEDHANQPHMIDPMCYVDGGHKRGPGVPRIDKMKVVVVKGTVTDDIIASASKWLSERNKGQMMSCEEIVAKQIEHMNKLHISSEYQEFVSTKKRESGDEDQSKFVKHAETTC